MFVTHTADPVTAAAVHTLAYLGSLHHWLSEVLHYSRTETFTWSQLEGGILQV